MRNKFVNILGVNISVTSYAQTLSTVQKSIEQNRKQFICVCAVNQIMQCYHSRSLLNGVNQAVLRVPDGMPLVWLSKLSGHTNVQRVYGVTLTEKLCKLAEKKKWKIFLLGGAKGQSTQLVRVLMRSFPSLKIVGSIDTPDKELSKLKNKNIIEKINRSTAQIILVGMGCPYQEKWMIQNRAALRAPILIGVGAVFDYLTGRIRKTPEWAKRAGLEWLFRLVQDPRRLWYRYTIQNLHFIFLISWRAFLKSI